MRSIPLVLLCCWCSLSWAPMPLVDGTSGVLSRDFSWIHPLSNPDTFLRLERKYRLPSGMLRAVHWRECSGANVCKDGRDGEIGPFQIKPGTAALMECSAFDADCAARYLRKALAKCRTVQLALTHYHAGAEQPCYRKPSEYGMAVYRSMLNGRM